MLLPFQEPRRTATCREMIPDTLFPRLTPFPYSEFLSAALRRRQGQESRTRCMHAEIAGHPQRHAETPDALAAP